MDIDLIYWLRWNAKEQGSRFGEAADTIERLRDEKEKHSQTCAIYWNEIQRLREQIGLETPWFGDVDWWANAALKESE